MHNFRLSKIACKNAAKLILHAKRYKHAQSLTGADNIRHVAADHQVGARGRVDDRSVSYWTRFGHELEAS
jgi:hypothetical protein